MSENYAHRFTAEYGARKCGCRLCKKDIDKGELRISFYSTGIYKSLHFYHPKCMFDSFTNRMKVKIMSLADISGMNGLKYSDGNIIKKHINDYALKCAKEGKHESKVANVKKPKGAAKNAKTGAKASTSAKASSSPKASTSTKGGTSPKKATKRSRNDDEEDEEPAEKKTKTSPKAGAKKTTKATTSNKTTPAKTKTTPKAVAKKATTSKKQTPAKTKITPKAVSKKATTSKKQSPAKKATTTSKATIPSKAGKKKVAKKPLMTKAAPTPKAPAPSPKVIAQPAPVAPAPVAPAPKAATKTAADKKTLSDEAKKSFRSLGNSVTFTGKKLTIDDFWEFTVNDLKLVLKLNDRSTTGNKSELAKQLVDYMTNGCPPRCPECGGGRLKVKKTGTKEQFYCPGFMEDEDFINCAFKSDSVARKAWISP